MAEQHPALISELASEVAALPPPHLRRHRRRRRTRMKPHGVGRWCGHCHYHLPLSQMDQWSCPRCEADLRLVGYYKPRGWWGSFKHACAVVTRRLTRRARMKPACPVCHYPVQGLASFACPECGCDFHKSDITEPDIVGRRDIVRVAGLAWVIFVALAAILTIDWCRRWLVPQDIQRYQELRLTSIAKPQYDIRLRGTGSQSNSWGGSIPLTRVGLTMKGVTRKGVIDESAVPWLYVDYPNGRWSYGAARLFDRENDIVQTAHFGFDSTVVRKFLRYANVDYDEARLEDEAVELSRIVHESFNETIELPQLDHFTFTWSDDTDFGPHFGWEQAPYFYWLIVWLAGTAIMWWWATGSARGAPGARRRKSLSSPA